jgi:ATP-dependent helicase/nuclease subunit B
LRAERKRWRDLTPADARKRIAWIAEAHARDYHDGLFAASARQRFAARQLSLALQDFVEVVVGWMAQNQFDPQEVEFQFGREAKVPEWRLPLGDGRALLFGGSIDRVDLLKRSDESALCVVLDFKSSAKSIEPVLLHNGIQLQLPAYLSVLRHLGDPKNHFGVAKLIPAGFFYVTLRGSYQRGKYRNEVLDERDATKRAAYQHSGRYDVSVAPLLDASGTGEQFKRPRRSGDSISAAEFVALLDQVDARLREFGQRIFAGDTSVDPYRKSTDTPCEFCDYQPVCRIDRWSHKYRALVPVAKS